MVDHNLIILMLPLIVSGVSIGVIVNQYMPDAVIMGCYVVLLAYVLTLMIIKTRKIWIMENPSVKAVR